MPKARNVSHLPMRLFTLMQSDAYATWIAAEVLAPTFTEAVGYFCKEWDWQLSINETLPYESTDGLFVVENPMKPNYVQGMTPLKVHEREGVFDLEEVEVEA